MITLLCHLLNFFFLLIFNYLCVLGCIHFNSKDFFYIFQNKICGEEKKKLINIKKCVESND